MKNKKLINRIISVMIIMFVIIMSKGAIIDNMLSASASNIDNFLKVVDVKSESNISLKKPDNVLSLNDKDKSASAQTKNLVLKVVNVLLYLTGILSVVFITISGTRFVVAAGTQDQIDGAKRSLLWSILGLLAVILSYALVQNVVELLYKGS